jgi:hypothetical protein
LGLPSSAPGWLFLLSWFALLFIFIVPLLPRHPMGFISALALWASIYVLICYTQGEPMPPKNGASG